MKGKRGMEDELLKWILAVAFLALMFFLYFILSGKGQGMIDYLNRLFKFG